MNVYSCWYRGNIGYTCRLRDRNWMFVPELGQADRRVHRGVPLSEIVFADPRAKAWEMDRDSRRPRGFGWARKLLLGRSEETRSVGGLLFTAG